VDLPAPVADLALQQVEVRRSHAVLGRTDSPWLFPGGRPGRPISAWAMGERLRKLGLRHAETRYRTPRRGPRLHPRHHRRRKWQRAAAGDWAAYAADVSRRNAPHQPIHEPGATP
jgi:hypothetical protein